MKKENFTLKKVRINNGQFEVTYTITEEDENGIIRTTGRKETHTGRPHADLFECFDNLRYLIGGCFGISDLREWVTTWKEEDMGVPELTEEQKAWIDEYTEGNTLQRIFVTEVKWQNEDTIIVGAEMEMRGLFGRMRTPKIDISENGRDANFGIWVRQLVDETYKYLFEGKVSDLEVFGATDDEED